MESLMPDGKALQMGTSHFLGQNFAKPFDVKYSDKDNIENYAWQTSWGVSWRLIGGMIMVHGDNKGLVLPPKVSPIQVVIVPIYYSDDDSRKVLDKANEIEKTLHGKQIRVHVDKRSELTPGFKFHDWELKGIPLRIEIGPKDIEKQKVVIATRHNQEKTDLAIDEINDEVEGILEKIQKEMFDAAKKILDDRSIPIENYTKFKEEIEKGGFLYAPWCGDESCEESIKDETGAEIRVIPFDDKNKEGKCVKCENPSKSTPIFARGY
jgi:prolyl-tRNA synthetase